jgi:hypothetical protein
VVERKRQREKMEIGRERREKQTSFKIIISSALRSPTGVEAVCRMIKKVIRPSADGVADDDRHRRKIFVDAMLKLFDEADGDGDGSIDFVEFLKHEWEGRWTVVIKLFLVVTRPY